MTDLYKEALLEAKKLKEIAEEDAKKSIIEALSPYVKNLITKQINESSDGYLFQEQEEEEVNTTDTSGLDLSASDLGDKSMMAPIHDPNAVNVELPSADSDGKLVVDVETLFVPDSEDEIEEEIPNVTQPETPTTPIEPNPTPDINKEPEKLMESYDSWKKEFLETSEKIDKVYFSKKVPEIVSESLKIKLFSLLENLDHLNNKGQIDSKQVKISENKLEFLFLKLKEAKLNNSYIEKDLKEDKNMTSLKEYAAKLFAESFSENDINQKTTASAKHAADVSGVAPGVDLCEDSMGSDASEQQWSDGKPTLSEKDQDKVIEEALAALEEEVEAEGHAGFGDTDEEPSVEPMLEIDEKELMEAIRQIKKESLKKKMSKLKESQVPEGDQGSVKPAAGMDPAQKNLDKKPGKSNLKPVDALMAEDIELGDETDMLDTGDVDVDMGSDDADGDLVLNIDLPDEVEEALADVDMSALEDINVSLSDINLGNDEETEMEDEESVEDMDLELPTDEEEVVGDEEDDKELLKDDEEDKEDDDMMAMEMKVMKESFGKVQSKNKLLEAKLTETVKMASNLKKEVSELKSELLEANLFIAKNVYFTKFLQRGDLSKSNLTKIVEHLDSAKTVQEAKEIYTKIKTKLAESVAASKKLTGSSSKATKSGSAVSLNESVNHEDGFVIDPKRWQKLANIKINDK